MKIHELTLPLDEVSGVRMTPVEFLAKYQAYKQSRDRHSLTLDTPAPFPDYEVFRVVYDRGESIEIVPADPLEQHRQERGRDVIKEFDDLVVSLRVKGLL